MASARRSPTSARVVTGGARHVSPFLHWSGNIGKLLEESKRKGLYPGAQDLEVHVSKDGTRYVVFAIEEDEDPDVFWRYDGIVGRSLAVRRFRATKTQLRKARSDFGGRRARDLGDPFDMVLNEAMMQVM